MLKSLRARGANDAETEAAVKHQNGRDFAADFQQLRMLMYRGWRYRIDEQMLYGPERRKTAFSVSEGAFRRRLPKGKAVSPWDYSAREVVAPVQLCTGVRPSAPSNSHDFRKIILDASDAPVRSTLNKYPNISHDLKTFHLSLIS